MLVNGVEVFDKPISLKQALNVQKQINRVPEMEDELKTSGDVSVTNNEIEEIGRAHV